jgi:hypothetical protein
VKKNTISGKVSKLQRGCIKKKKGGIEGFPTVSKQIRGMTEKPKYKSFQMPKKERRSKNIGQKKRV